MFSCASYNFKNPGLLQFTSQQHLPREYLNAPAVYHVSTSQMPHASSNICLRNLLMLLLCAILVLGASCHMHQTNFYLRNHLDLSCYSFQIAAVALCWVVLSFVQIAYLLFCGLSGFVMCCAESYYRSRQLSCCQDACGRLVNNRSVYKCGTIWKSSQSWSFSFRQPLQIPSELLPIN